MQPHIEFNLPAQQGQSIFEFYQSVLLHVGNSDQTEHSVRIQIEPLENVLIIC